MTGAESSDKEGRVEGEMGMGVGGGGEDRETVSCHLSRCTVCTVVATAWGVVGVVVDVSGPTNSRSWFWDKGFLRPVHKTGTKFSKANS